MTPEERAELRAEVQKLFGPYQKPKPKVVVSDGRVVRDADVVVSPRDPNAWHDKATSIQVRRPDPEWLGDAEKQLIAQHRQRSANARLRQEADPFGYGHWSSPE